MFKTIESAIIYLMGQVIGFFNISLESLQQRLIDLHQQQTDIVNLAEAEDRDLSDDEVDKLEALDSTFKATKRQLEHLERINDNAQLLTQGTGRKTQAGELDNSGAGDGSNNRQLIKVGGASEKGKHGFNSFGQFAQAVRIAHPSMGMAPDPRLLKNAPSTYSTEGVGADGGFAVPPDFRTEIMEKVKGEESLLSRVDTLESAGNSVNFPKDETTPWDSSGGIQAYWEGEAAQFTQSKVALEGELMKLNKLTALVPVTSELIEDAPALDSYLRRKVPMKFDFKITDKIINGTGVGMPTGVLNAGATVEVAKESGQAADTIVFENIVNMWSRMYGPCRSNAVWMINQDIEPQLFTMSFEGTSSSVPAYMPANGLSASPYGTLMGRPVIPTQACQTLGDAGDIIFADWSQYLAILKTGGIKDDVSVHLYFDYDMVAYRFILRMSGQPWWRTAITPLNSSNTLGAFVKLAARA